MLFQFQLFFRIQEKYTVIEMIKVNKKSSCIAKPQNDVRSKALKIYSTR